MASSAPKRFITIDRDRVLQLVFMAVIALYLILSLAWPLYAMLSKSMTTYRFNPTPSRFRSIPVPAGNRTARFRSDGAARSRKPAEA
jgi:hypothetical protein